MPKPASRINPRFRQIQNHIQSLSPPLKPVRPSKTASTSGLLDEPETISTREDDSELILRDDKHTFKQHPNEINLRRYASMEHNGKSAGTEERDQPELEETATTAGTEETAAQEGQENGMIPASAKKVAGKKTSGKKTCVKGRSKKS